MLLIFGNRHPQISGRSSSGISLPIPHQDEGRPIVWVRVVAIEVWSRSGLLRPRSPRGTISCIRGWLQIIARLRRHVVMQCRFVTVQQSQLCFPQGFSLGHVRARFMQCIELAHQFTCARVIYRPQSRQDRLRALIIDDLRKVQQSPAETSASESQGLT